MADVDIDLYDDVEQDFTQDREMSWMTLLTETCMTQSSRVVEESGTEKMPVLPRPPRNVTEAPPPPVSRLNLGGGLFRRRRELPSLGQFRTVDVNFSSTLVT